MSQSTDVESAISATVKTSFALNEESISWRTLIFVPFKKYWRFVLTVLIYYEINAVLIIITYNFGQPDTKGEIPIQLTDTLFLLHIVFLMMHRIIKKERLKRAYKPRNLHLLIIDIITIIPVNGMYKLFTDIGWSITDREKYATYIVRDYARLIVLLRYHEVCSLLNDWEQTSVASQFLVIVKFSAHSILAIQILASLWKTMACWKCERPNWTDNLKNYKFDPDNPLEWMVICWTAMGNLFLTQFETEIKSVTVQEDMLVIFTILLGYLAKYLFFVGMIVVVFSRAFRRQYKFFSNLSIINIVTSRWNISKSSKKRLFEYYYTLWEKKMGILRYPRNFYLLPATLQRDSALDMNWDALQHSLLFKNTSSAFKRAVSMQMENVILLAGDYLFMQDVVKYKMIYIKTGLVEILSAEDDDSVIISFSGGTVLSEINLFFPLQSKLYVRCATYTELNTLQLHKLCKVMSLFPQDAGMLRKEIQIRLEFAKFMKKQKDKFVNKSQVEKSGIRWLKTQWRRLSRMRKTKKRTIKVNPMHCSDYLTLYSIKEGIEIRTQVICLKGSWPFLLDPSSSFRIFCNYFIVILFFIECTLTPYYIAFLGDIPFELFTLFTMFDIFYLIDIFLQLSTAIKLNDSLITKHSQILLHKVKSLPFFIDFITAIPASQIARMADPSYNYGWMRCIKCLRGYQFLHLLEMRANKNIYNVSSRFFRYILIFLYSIYWWACIFYVVTCYGRNCTEYGWYRYSKYLYLQRWDTMFGYWNSPFLISYTYVLAGFASISITRFFPYTISDILMHFFFLGCTGIFIKLLTYGDLTALMFLNRQMDYSRKRAMRTVNEHLTANKLDKNKIDETLQYLEFQWKIDKFTGKERRMDYIPDHLRDDFIKQRIMSTLMEDPLFKYLGMEMVQELKTLTEVRTFPPNTVICLEKSQGVFFRIICRGYVELKSILLEKKNKNFRTVLTRGESIITVELLHGCDSLVQATAITAVEICTLRVNKFWKAMERFPKKREKLKIILKEHLEEHDNILKRKRVRLPQFDVDERSLGQSDVFGYDVMRKRKEDREWREYITPFRQLGKWSFIRFVMIPKGVDPKGTFFITWECFRSFAVIARILMALFYYAFYDLTPVRILRGMFICIYVADLYIRLHCHYYNDNKILVTHPVACAKYYWRTSFLFDAISYIPKGTINVNTSFRNQNLHLKWNFIILLLRIIQLNRVIQGMSYLQYNVKRSTILFVVIRFLLICSVTLGTIAALFQLLVCDMDVRDNTSRLVCRDNTWIATSRNFQPSDVNKWTSHLFSIDMALQVFMSSGSFHFKAYTQTEAVTVAILMVGLFFFALLLTANLVGHMAGGDTALTVYRQRIKKFLAFMEKTRVSEDVVKATVDHYEHVWKMTKGISKMEIYSFLNLSAREDICNFLFGRVLKNTQLLCDSEISTVKHLSTHLEEKFIERGANIIRCNEIQSNVYIVKTGRVDITVAKTTVCTLGPGGMFGCFTKEGMIRHTITATANVHVSLLEIPCKKLYEHVKPTSKEALRLKQINYINGEFIQQVELIHENANMHNKIVNESDDHWKYKRNILRFGRVISREGAFYSWWENLVYVYLAPVSTLILMFLIFLENSRSMTYFDKVFFYTLDVIFIAKMVVDSHLDYVDSESGLIIRNLVRIRKAYFTSFSGFWFNLLTILPFEVFAGFFMEENVKYFAINRLFRYYYFIMYYIECKRKVQIMARLRLIFLTHNFLLCIQLSACIWYTTACQNTCLDLEGMENVDVNSREILLKSYAVLYKFVVSITCKIKTANPQKETIMNMFVAMILTAFFEILTLWMTAEFITLRVIGSHSASNYKYRTSKVKAFFEKNDMFPHVVDNIKTYFSFLGHYQAGEQIPSIIKEAPMLLKIDLLYGLYGQHLHRHLLFSKTHVDFVKQLSVHLNRVLYAPRNYLVKTGDVDGCMYFIEDGEVGVYEAEGDVENLKYTLGNDESFGEEQGLFLTPHKWSYKAETVVIALSLNMKDWMYLLKWFPASKEVIENRSKHFKPRTHLPMMVSGANEID